TEHAPRAAPEERCRADAPLPRRPVGPAEKQEAEEREQVGPPAVWTGQPWIKGFSHGEPPCMKTGVQRGEKGRGEAQTEGRQDREGVELHGRDPDEAIQMRDRPGDRVENLSGHEGPEREATCAAHPSSVKP